MHRENIHLIREIINNLETNQDCYKQELNLSKNSSKLTGLTDAAIGNILNRFHQVVIQLRDRYDNRETLDVADEYDVQDLLHTLLTLYCDDIRPEEWTPSYAGTSSRQDFLLKNEKIVIETKKTRKGLNNKELSLIHIFLDKAEKQQPMTLLEKDFLEENMAEIDSEEKK